jgi:hypothetical protein
MTAAIRNVKASVATVNAASELSSGRIRHGAEMSRNLRISKASKHIGVNVTFCGKDFRTSAVSPSLVP